VVVRTIQDIKDWIAKNPVDIIAIDEGQFFDIHELNIFASSQADQGKIVVIATLDQDFRTIPFDGVPKLIVDADFTQQLHPVCVGCGGLASRSRRTVDVGDTIHVGGKEAYEPLCRTCYNEREMDDFQEHATEE
jgi:thymidine kinase